MCACFCAYSFVNARRRVAKAVSVAEKAGEDVTKVLAASIPAEHSKAAAAAVEAAKAAAKSAADLKEKKAPEQAKQAMLWTETICYNQVTDPNGCTRTDCVRIHDGPAMELQQGMVVGAGVAPEHGDAGAARGRSGGRASTDTVPGVE